VELDAEEVLQGYPITNPGVAVSSSALACVRYESDEAGVPAGRMIPHLGLAEKSISGGQESWTGARYVLDHEGELLPVGAVGDLYVGGESAGWGYGHRSGLTAQRYIPNAFSTTRGGICMGEGRRPGGAMDIDRG
jgi:non-ribosomal peptide synthetase component F